ncbi:hypothetical protein [Pseudoalteromonas luteoviolacea]|uniref:Uncharacterized protein n=1 Tax=Pseudoalteromonas luteoviolacea S4054 TaxID=1129367 RepID=A0A0F6ADA8_9GAMM|nr:hypothetical protein [Pseudoalteromonas luteoviolacea]AOT08239.1 hypothetical protein S4054249_10480 [Pseudoalteromonas luteoviolacea]AOT13155.1 hypothetical protein S40542_10455 [Pseudoalteromonas luteoviolacea]AOT18067.1 hypothetical protein S4054_10450 [Pseudoalteromonas luteoviolacea]KKE84170.1 hypothetical protein N479_09735 [Pseudoalteromonas luteoviolacea S4054]KZN76225.1 hypothetical protein N481_07680 [Pseudoalteromonas luteoviolacea S4047-1]
MSTNHESMNILECEIPPDCEVLHRFSQCVNACMRRCGFTRNGLAQRMNAALKVDVVEVDEGKLNKWFAPSQPTSMPIQYLPALCWAIKSVEPANILLMPLMYSASDERAKKLQEASECEVQMRELQDKRESILESVKINT